MAVYKRDMVDINLETGNIHRSFLRHSIGFKDAAADHFGIRVFRNGEPVSLTGVSVQGIFMPPQGDPIAITSGNIVDGNVAEVVLPQACYNYDGQFTLAIKLVDATNAVTGTMRIVDGMVDNTHASGTVAPTSAVPGYEEVLATYEQAVAAINKTVRFDATQSLTSTQQTTARNNIDAAKGSDMFKYMMIDSGSTKIVANTDMDDVKTAGSYWISTSDYASITNLPKFALLSGQTIRVFVIKISSSTLMQFILTFGRNTSINIIGRCFNNGAWTGWRVFDDSVFTMPSTYSSADNGIVLFLNSTEMQYGKCYVNITESNRNIVPDDKIPNGLTFIEKKRLTSTQYIAYIHSFTPDTPTPTQMPTVFIAISNDDGTFTNVAWNNMADSSTKYKLTSGDDLNDKVKKGEYICSTYNAAAEITHSPIIKAYKMYVDTLNMTNRIIQICVPIQNNTIFTRYGSKDNGVWSFSNWARISTLSDLINVSEGGTEARSRDGMVYRSDLQSSLIRKCKHIIFKALDFLGYKSTYYNSYDGPKSKHIWDRMSNCSIYVGDIYNLMGYPDLYPSHKYGQGVSGEGSAYDVMVQEDDRTLAKIQAKLGDLVDYAVIAPGNLFFASNSPHGIDNIVHVGMCLGNGFYIHESSANQGNGPSRSYLFIGDGADRIRHYCEYDDFSYNEYNFDSFDGKYLITIYGQTKENIETRTYDDTTYVTQMYSNLPTITDPCTLSSAASGGSVTMTVNGSSYTIPVDRELNGVGDVCDTIEYRGGSYKYVKRIEKRLLSSDDEIEKQTVGSNYVYVFTNIELPNETPIFHITSNFCLRRPYTEIETESNCVGVFRIQISDKYYLAYSSGSTNYSVTELKDLIDDNDLYVCYNTCEEVEENVSSTTLNAIKNIPVIAGSNTITVSGTPPCLLEIQYADSENGSLFFEMVRNNSKAKIGTESNRPSDVENGYLYYNTTQSALQIYNGETWVNV